MLLDPDTENDVAYELCQLLGRAILPVSQLDRPGGSKDFGTAFFFTEQAGAGDLVQEYLLTADAITHAPCGEIGLRPSLTEPAGEASEAILLPDFAGRWIHFPEVGLAAMPTGGLHERARAEGWRWRTQQVTDSIAARPEAVARIGAAPSSAFVLALGVADDGSRPLEAAIERLVRDGYDVRIPTELPRGYVGAPVFGVQATADGDIALSCVGLVLPGGGGGHPVATFDRIRAAIAAAPDA
ncbi:hypothetical protein GA0070624_6423 [Micromonospora rhizosphaerae]|uniref:Uncharacterized protein n=1 Tax=Micromonospora rhizosphaerae TaxID=568872 RepID=A0A1C6TBU9_9ACTN|nr:hypothetical protein [Micromonospora rhizosphaerae]SCL39032.1 hypothetical protein GA0070624_6423 [Micromonospora rhizosphaerae]